MSRPKTSPQLSRITVEDIHNLIHKYAQAINKKGEADLKKENPEGNYENEAGIEDRYVYVNVGDLKYVIYTDHNLKEFYEKFEYDFDVDVNKKAVFIEHKNWTPREDETAKGEIQPNITNIHNRLCVCEEGSETFNDILPHQEQIIVAAAGDHYHSVLEEGITRNDADDDLAHCNRNSHSLLNEIYSKICQYHGIDPKQEREDVLGGSRAFVDKSSKSRN